MLWKCTRKILLNRINYENFKICSSIGKPICKKTVQKKKFMWQTPFCALRNIMVENNLYRHRIQCTGWKQIFHPVRFECGHSCIPNHQFRCMFWKSKRRHRFPKITHHIVVVIDTSKSHNYVTKIWHFIHKMVRLIEERKKNATFHRNIRKFHFLSQQLNEILCCVNVHNIQQP